MRPWVGLALAVWLAVALSGCKRERATPELCGRILDRIVELELGERGYRDQVLVERKKAQLRVRFADELGRCVGRGVRAGARACIDKARHTEEISHRCLE
jgi:hypothetical protein